MPTDTYLTARQWFLADLISSNVKLGVLDAGFTPADTDEFLDDIDADLVDVSNNLTGKSLHDGWFVSDPAVVADATGADVAGVVLFIDTGVASTSRLICYWTQTADDNPIDVELDGTDLTINPSELGWFTV